VFNYSLISVYSLFLLYIYSVFCNSLYTWHHDCSPFMLLHLLKTSGGSLAICKAPQLSWSGLAVNILITKHYINRYHITSSVYLSTYSLKFTLRDSWYSIHFRYGTGRDFLDPTRPVTCLFDRLVDRRKFSIVDRFLTGRLPRQSLQKLD